MTGKNMPNGDSKTVKHKEEDDVRVINDSKWTEGDFEIISADNVRFRCPGVHLFSSSSVFRTAHNLDKGNASMTFTDPVIESAAVLRLWLSVMSTGSLGRIPRSLPNVKELVLFLTKWECDATLAIVLMEVELRFLHANAVSTDAFMVAANANAVHLASLVLTESANHTWPALSSGTPDLHAGTPGQNIWNPAHWPSSFWSSGVPILFLFAASRAWGEAGGTNANKGLAAAFEKYIKVMP